MSPRISKDELRRLRNAIDIAQLVAQLGLRWKRQEGVFRFLCPLCGEYNTATNPRTNLARCFRCERNFNPIDLVMVVEQLSFLDAVRRLRRIAEDLDSGDHPQIS